MDGLLPSIRQGFRHDFQQGDFPPDDSLPPGFPPEQKPALPSGTWPEHDTSRPQPSLVPRPFH
jgi:hypothetical protein